MQKHADEAGIPVRGGNRSLVPIGKPKGQSSVTGNSFCVEFFEARINVYTEEDLVTVLKAVKQTSAILCVRQNDRVFSELGQLGEKRFFATHCVQPIEYPGMGVINPEQ